MQDISLHILDLVQNSIVASASLIEIAIKDIPEQKQLSVMIRDNGRGMDENEIIHVTDPFYTTRTTRRVGLGIPLFKASAEASGGYMEIQSNKGIGTNIKAVFDNSHIDCLPIGKMEETMAALIFCNPDVNFTYTHQYADKQFILNTSEIREQLGELTIAHPQVIGWITEYIIDGLNEIYGGV